MIHPPILPMLALKVGALPDGEGWLFEPKWDGFRALVFKDGTDVFIQSRDGKPLARYFPELVEPLRALSPRQAVLDGEIVIARNGALDFEAMQLRLHPAASRVRLLAEETPASIVFFDLLWAGSSDLRTVPFADRRAALESTLAGVPLPLLVTPVSRDRRVAVDWFRRFEGGAARTGRSARAVSPRCPAGSPLARVGGMGGASASRETTSSRHG